ncbi:unnamed protein product [Owenia fusiformis]|uniref:ShKT domain-containing protein n=1 Tax=Owenia fusiformis TaxID=6347 RepID=A0A8S4N9K6_OWEFU|nr:unnamed protein product [Owenia fusiformis]
MDVFTMLSLFVSILMLFSECQAFTKCSFPLFMQTFSQTHHPRHWITQRVFSRPNSERVDTEHEFTVDDSVIANKYKFQEGCRSRQGKSQCAYTRTQPQYNLTCLSERHGKYTVRKDDVTGKGWPTKYQCIQFISRTDNVLQIKSGPPTSTLDDDLCDDKRMRLDDWPWYSHTSDARISCPFTAGYDFDGFLPSNNRRVHDDGREHMEPICKEWRPSRLESECINGEGLDFIFPNPACNIFGQQNNVQLLCWASWVEEAHMYIITKAKNSEPHYTLRIPLNRDLHGFTARLYFNVVSPSPNRGGTAYKGNYVKYVEMFMSKSDSGLCYDESSKCSEYAKQGKCISRPPYEYANYCKKSCGLCGPMPSPLPECSFPNEYQGNWELYGADPSGKDIKDDVFITGGLISSRKMGSFVCKGKHYASHKYKLLTTFDNGCRPRYTCVLFTKPHEQLLQYRMARSVSYDQSIHNLCAFDAHSSRSDDTGVGNILIAKTSDANKCGLDGQYSFNVASKDGVAVPEPTCSGIISDWDSANCSSKTKLDLYLDLEKCPRMIALQSFTCRLELKYKHGVKILLGDGGENKELRSIHKLPCTRLKELSLTRKALVNTEDLSSLILDVRNSGDENGCGSGIQRAPPDNHSKVDKGHQRNPIYKPPKSSISAIKKPTSSVTTLNNHSYSSILIFLTLFNVAYSLFRQIRMT